MRFIVSKEKLELAVKNICRVIEPKQPMPILRDVRCEVKGHFMKMIGSDSEVQLSYDVYLSEEAEGEGNFCVDASRLSDALANLTEQPLTIIADTENGDAAKFEIQHESGRTYFPIENADEFPLINRQEEAFSSVMPAKELALAINCTIWTTANDPLRPVMSGIYFGFCDDKTDIVASNGHTLMLFRTGGGSAETGSFVMPRKVANILTKTLEWPDNDDCDIMWSENQGCIEQEGWSLVFRLVEGKYPNYESVIPKNQPYKLEVDNSTLINCIKKVSPFSPDSSNMITCEIHKDILLAIGENPDFFEGSTNTINIDCNIDKKVMKIAMKAGTTINTLKHIPYTKIAMNFESPNRAFVFTNYEKDNEPYEITGLEMPMMTSDEPENKES